ncbi:MAG: HEPN domain-containing protein [Chloroflexota bacterium]
MGSPTDWLYFAREDLRVAELTLSNEIYNQVCFHSQQCCEKALKAWLAHQGIESPRKHQLSVLLALSTIDIFAELGGDIVRLDRFYIPTRYPDVLAGSLPEGLPNKANAEEAIDTARKVLHRVEQHISTQPSR